MSDLSQFSDADLMAIAGMGGGEPAQSSDLSGFSNEDLMAIAGVEQGPKVPSIWESPLEALGSKDWWLTRSNEDKPISLEQAIQGPLTSAADGLAFGLGDEGAAALKAPFTDLTYDQELEKARGYQKSFSEAAPVADIGLQIAASLRNPLVMASKVGQVPGALKKIGQAGKEGAVVGSLFGFGEGEGGVIDRAENAATGGLIGGATGGTITGATQAGSKLANRYSNKLAEASDEVLEKGLGIQYGDRTKGLNRVNLFVDDAGNTVPFDQLDDAAGIMAPIQQQVQTLKEAGFLKNAPNDTAGLKIHITKEGSKVGKQIPQLVREADKVLGRSIINPQFPQAEKYIKGFLPEKQQELRAILESKRLEYESLPGSGFSKLDDFVNKIQKETKFDSATPPETTQLKRFMQFDARKTAEKVFDNVVPGLKGQYAKANEIVAASEAIKKTLNKPLAKQGTTFGNLLSGGSKPVAAVAAATAPVIGLGPAAILAGAPILKNAAVKYAEAVAPVSTAKTYNALSEFLKSTAPGIARRQSAANPLAAIATQGQQNTEQPESEIQLDSSRDSYQGFGISAESSSSLEPKSSPAANQAQISGLLGLTSNDIPDTASLFSNTAERSLFDGGKMDAPQAEVREADMARPGLLAALKKTESNNNPKAIGPKTKYGRAKGAYQFLDATGKEWHERLGLPGEYDPFNEDQQGVIAEAYLDHLIERYDGDEKLALASYNWGMGNLDKLIKRKNTTDFEQLANHMPEETQNYVQKITRIAQA